MRSAAELRGLAAITRPTRRQVEFVDDGEAQFITPARARLIRQRIEVDAETARIVGAPADVTGCDREGCDGRFSKCYLPASLCRRIEP